MDQWYIAKDGQQEGPVTPQQIGALVKAGAIDPATALVWREGLTDWKSLAESGLLAETGAIAPAPAVPAFNNPYHVTERTRNALDQPRQAAVPEYPGYNRLRYFLSILVLMVVFYAILGAIMFTMISSKSSGVVVGLAMVVIVLLMMGGSIYIGVQRLLNLGMSGWAILWTLVPFMNIWIGWRMIACPAGYEHHRTMDTPAKVITGLWIGMIVLSFVVNILAAVMSQR